MSLSEEALRALAAFAVQRLCGLVDLGEASSTARETALRLALVQILHAMPLANRSLHLEAATHDAFAPLIFYERVRTGRSNSLFFFDGLPTALDLFGGPTTITLSPEQVAKLKMRDLVSDRLMTIGKLEKMPVQMPRRLQLVSENRPGDLHGSVPGPVCVLVSRARALVQCMRRAKRGVLFPQCSNVTCNRRFYLGERAEQPASEVEVPAGDESEEEGDGAAYWNVASGEAECPPPPARRRFCCRACSQQHERHLREALPLDDASAYDVDDALGGTGRSRVARSFRAALKRNETAARRLRTFRARKGLAVSASEIERHRARHVRALNVDLALLLASSIVAECAVLSSGKLLPGATPRWREDPLFFAKGVAEVVKIYVKTHRRSSIISSLLTVPPFIASVKERSGALFQ
jgi:hypothetical protein